MADIEYSFGWTPSLPDIRDDQYNVSSTVRGLIPPFLDLSQPSLGVPFDPRWGQGSIGSCGPHTLGANLVFVDLVDGAPSPRLATPDSVAGAIVAAGEVKMPSRLFLYYNARVLMNTVQSDSGVNNRSMLKSLAQFGYCDEELWPYDVNRFTVRPPAACYDQAAARKSTIKYKGVPQDLQQMRGCLAELRRPIIFGFSVYQSLMNPDVERSGLVPYPRGSDRMVGGHDVLIVGYNDGPGSQGGIPAGHFKFANSWTIRWGINGYGFIPYEYASSPGLASDFWVVTDVADPIPPPVPPTPPVPPSTLKDAIDKVFAALKTAFAAYPTVVMFLVMAHDIIIKLLTSNTFRLSANYGDGPFSPSQLKRIIDEMLDQAIASASNAFERMALQVAKQMIDEYLLTQVV